MWKKWDLIRISPPNSYFLSPSSSSAITSNGTAKTTSNSIQSQKKSLETVIKTTQNTRSTALFEKVARVSSPALEPCHHGLPPKLPIRSFPKRQSSTITIEKNSFLKNFGISVKPQWRVGRFLLFFFLCNDHVHVPLPHQSFIFDAFQPYDTPYFLLSLLFPPFHPLLRSFSRSLVPGMGVPHWQSVFPIKVRIVPDSFKNIAALSHPDISSPESPLFTVGPNLCPRYLLRS